MTSVLIALLTLLTGGPFAGCEQQPVSLADSPATLISKFGEPSRTEDVAPLGSEAHKTFLEWDRLSQHMAIVVDSASAKTSSVLFTERGSRCTMWEGVAVGKASVTQLLEVRGKDWSRRHYGCDDLYVRLTFTYEAENQTGIEYTAFVPKASLGAFAAELCQDIEDTITEEWPAKLERNIDRLQESAHGTRILAVALRSPPNRHSDSSDSGTSPDAGLGCRFNERRISVCVGARVVEVLARGSWISHVGDVMVYTVRTDAPLAKADLAPGSDVRTFAVQVFSEVASDADRCGVKSALVDVITDSSCCEYDNIEVHFRLSPDGWKPHPTPLFHYRER